jgi:hypothetical protein
LLEQTKAIGDANAQEHERTRTENRENYAKTHCAVEEATQKVRFTITGEGEKTRQLVAIEHERTTGQILTDQANMRESLAARIEESSTTNEAEHRSTRDVITTSVIDQIARECHAIETKLQQDIDYLDTELFRSQLQNEVHHHNNYVWSRDLARQENRLQTSEILGNVQAQLQALKKLQITALNEKTHDLSLRVLQQQIEYPVVSSALADRSPDVLQSPTLQGSGESPNCQPEVKSSQHHHNEDTRSQSSQSLPQGSEISKIALLPFFFSIILLLVQKDA